MTPSEATRRRFLAGASASFALALAGCGRDADQDATPTPIEYDHLGQRTLYPADGLGLTVPENLETTQTRDGATLFLLPGTTDVAATQAVEWLDSQRVVALLGDGAEGTWLDWARSDAYAETFGRGGVADPDPDPDLVVLRWNGQGVSPHHYTWGNPYDDADVFEAIEDALGPDDPP